MGWGAEAEAGTKFVLHFRSSQITELSPKVSELFIQLLKCYRLLGNITIDSVEFEV